MATTPDHASENVLHIAPPIGTDVQLEEAFADSYILFNETTRRYMEAYKQLEEQFEYLNVRLEETNRELRESLEEKDRVSNNLNNILESMSGGVLVTGLDSRITLFNRTAEELTGRSQEQALDQPYEEVMGLDAGRENSVLHTIDTGDSLTNQEKDLRRTDGRVIPVGFSTSLVRDQSGQILGAVEVFNDMTEVRRLEAQVRRMHTLAALGEMAATVAHEIRNPLGGIASFANLLERDLDVDNPSRRLVRKITEGVARLNRIVSSLLSYTRPLNLNTHNVNLAQTVEEATAFFEIDLERKTQAVEIERHLSGNDGAPCPCTCQLDPEQFHQVILNLLLNATQAMPDGGRIVLHVHNRSDSDGEWAVVSVSDTGSGIDEEIRDKLFTPFFTTKEDGTGLGLVTSRKIVEAHGGQITVDSTPGEGTCFTISLPV
ncbi:MAG: ATP-binding protein [Candidatus Latescibacterota bacterium]|nr:ATP-binding protein [Candidatus Latescibacterota bacterium]